jgi:hypothetical protein
MRLCEEAGMRKFLRGDDGVPVGDGDSIEFSYGIPPVRVIAKVKQIGKSLVVLTPGHEPEQCYLRSLRQYVGSWYKTNAHNHPAAAK